MICRGLARFAWFIFLVNIVKKITEWEKRGKMWQVEAVNRNKNVVKIGGFYYDGYFNT